MSVEVVDFLRRTSEKCGYKRERYSDKNAPDEFKNISVVMFYGDTRSAFILSTMLLHRMNYKYLIVCSHPKWGGIFHQADEFWSLKDESMSRIFIDGTLGFGNLHKEKFNSVQRLLNRYFENVYYHNDFVSLYKNGFTTEFFNKHQWIVYNLPELSTASVDFNKKMAQYSGFKVAIFPQRKIRHWIEGKENLCNVDKKFWVDLCRSLLDNNIVPVVVMDSSTHDVSDALENKVIYLSNLETSDLISHLRAVGCVLDVSQGVNRLAAMARCPFLAVAERRRWSELKEYEIDDLTCNNIPYEYIFSFPTVIESGKWQECIASIVSRFGQFLPKLNRDQWVSTSELSVVLPYSQVRKRKRKRLGNKFIKVQKL